MKLTTSNQVKQEINTKKNISKSTKKTAGKELKETGELTDLYQQIQEAGEGQTIKDILSLYNNQELLDRMEKLNYSDISNIPENKIEIFNQTKNLKKFQEIKTKKKNQTTEIIEPEKPKKIIEQKPKEGELDETK